MLRTGSCHVGKQPQCHSNKHPFSESQAASLPLTSPRSSLAKIVLTCRQSVIMPDLSLTHFQFLSYPPLSPLFLTLSLQPHHPSPDTAHSVNLLSAFSCSLHSYTVLTKQLLDDIFRGSPPPIFFPPCSTNKHSTPLLEQENSIRALITASSGMHSSTSLTKGSCLFCLLRQLTTR